MKKLYKRMADRKPGKLGKRMADRKPGKLGKSILRNVPLKSLFKWFGIIIGLFCGDNPITFMLMYFSYTYFGFLESIDILNLFFLDLATLLIKIQSLF